MTLAWAGLGIGLVSLWCLSLVMTLWGTWLAFSHFRLQKKISPSLPPVSILKPLKGVDSGLYANLESFFQLDYPCYELIFCVADPSDPSLAVVESLRRKYCQVASRLLVGEAAVGVNPKINNLVPGFLSTQFETILISDSNVRANAGYLQSVVAALSSDVGVVTSVVAGTNSRSVGGHLEADYLNTFFARWMFLSRYFGFPSVVGKSMLFTKATAMRFGGIQTLGGYIAEDYMAGHAATRLGLKVGIAYQPVHQFIGEYGFSDFWSRHIRWGRIRKSLAPMAFLGEPVMLCFPSGLVGALGLSILFGVPLFPVFALHALVWFALDQWLTHTMGVWRWASLPMWWVREVAAIAVWARTMMGDTVKWRGREYRLKFGGIVLPAGGT